MSFTLSDIIIENSIRQGLNIIRAAALSPNAADANSTINQILDVLFDFTTTGVQVRAIGPDGRPLPPEQEGGLGSAVGGKYTFEKQRLREYFRDNEIAIVHAFSDVQTNLPCVSIQLAADGEDQGLALTDDFGGISGVDVITTTDAALGRDINTIHANATINVGIHTKEQLLTKYIYHVIKYTILSNKLELIRQNFIIATFRGSDFTRDAGWQGDHVYTRFLNISGKTEDSWTNIDELVVAGESVDLSLLVPNDVSSGTAVPMNTPASTATTTVAAGSTMIQVANSSYLPTSGLVRLVTRNGFGVVQNNLEITITANDKNTNILTTSTAITTAFDVVISEDLATRRTTEVRAGDTTVIVATIETVPATPTTSLNKQIIADADNVVHRDNIATRPTT